MIKSLAKTRTMLLLGLSVLMAAMVFLNLQNRLYQKPLPDDGVVWIDSGKGVRASSVRVGSAADRAGIVRGDYLRYVNFSEGIYKVEDARDIFFVLDEKVGVGGSITYTIERQVTEGKSELWDADLKDIEAEPSRLPLQLFMAAVGLVFVLIGCYILLKNPGASYISHFFLICLSVFAVYSLSSVGDYTFSDDLVFIVDTTAFILLAPLFLHFCLIFPFRREFLERRPYIAWLLYLPAMLLIVSRLLILFFSSKHPWLIHWHTLVGRIEVVHFSAAFVASTILLLLTFVQTRASVLRQQLKWITWGLSLSSLPFTVLYAYPFILGNDISQLQAALAIGPSVLLPVSFGYSIVRYRLMDVDVIVRRSMSYALATISVVVIFMLGVVKAGEWVREVVPSASEGATLLLQVAVMSIAAMLFTPIKNWLEERIDRLFFGERYDYRTGIAEFGRTLSSTAELGSLLSALARRLSEMLSVNRIAIFIENDSKATGYRLAYARDLREPALLPDNFAVIAERMRSSYIPATEVEDGDAVQRQLHYYIPCYIRDRLVAVIGLGKTVEDAMLTSEDLELVRDLSGYVAVAIENSLLLKSEKEKATAFERLKDFSENIIESINIGLVAVDREGYITNWNSALEELMAIAREYAIGRPIREVFDEDLLNTIRSATGSLGWDLRSVHNIYRYKTTSRDGQEFVVNISLSPLEAKDGSIAGSLILLEDITSRVRLEEQMRENDKLSSIGLLAAGVAHEVNTPLTGISSYTQMLLSQIPPTDAKYTILEKIKRQTMRASDIVNNLLNFSRTGNVEHAEVEINRILDDTIQLLEPQLRGTQINIDRQYGENLPKCSGSSNKLQQVFMNLLLNARDAMPQGGTLTIKTQCNDSQILIDILDTGIGIAPENIAKIYDPFFTTKGIGQGTGLGLAVSYGIIQEHNGRIFVESKPGQGTRFHIKLPTVTHRVQAIAGD